MTKTPHITLLEMLSRPVTGDSEGIGKKEEIIAPIAEKAFKIENIPAISEEKSDTVTPEDIRAGEQIYHEALAYIKDAIAPAMIKVSPHETIPCLYRCDAKCI